MKKSGIWQKATLGLMAASVIGSTLAATAVEEKRVSPAVTKINKRFLMTKQMGYEWNFYKSLAGPTYAGSPGWKSFSDFVVSQAQEFGLVDIDTGPWAAFQYLVRERLREEGVTVAPDGSL